VTLLLSVGSIVEVEPSVIWMWRIFTVVVGWCTKMLSYIKI